MPIRAYYNEPVCLFLGDDREHILGVLASGHHHDLEQQQRSAWLRQISILKSALSHPPNGRVFLEFYIPRMGKRSEISLCESAVSVGGGLAERENKEAKRHFRSRARRCILKNRNDQTREIRAANRSVGCR